MIRVAILAASLLSVPLAVHAQSGPTQSRDGLGSGSGSQVAAPSNSVPAGAINAQTGPQSRPAYGSGPSTSPNPGAAFVRDTPVPSTGPARSPPGGAEHDHRGRGSRDDDAGRAGRGRGRAPAQVTPPGARGHP